jgi:hypothetical protein
MSGTRSDKQNFLIKNLICRRRKCSRVRWEPYYCKKVSGFHGMGQSWIISEFPVVDPRSSPHTLDQEKIDFQASAPPPPIDMAATTPKTGTFPPPSQQFPIP